MKEITLQDYCAEKSQKEAAKVLNCTPGAVSQMLKAQRAVFLVIHGSGEITSYERSPINKRKRAPS